MRLYFNMRLNIDANVILKKWLVQLMHVDFCAGLSSKLC